MTITNIRDNFIHIRLLNVIQILSIHQPNFPTTLILMGDNTLINESLINFNSNILLFSHDISYYFMIYIIIS